MTAFVVVLISFLALLTVADLLAALPDVRAGHPRSSTVGTGGTPGG